MKYHSSFIFVGAVSHQDESDVNECSACVSYEFDKIFSGLSGLVSGLLDDVTLAVVWGHVHIFNMIKCCALLFSKNKCFSLLKKKLVLFMVACDSIMCEPNTNVYTHKSFPQVAFFVCDTFMCVAPFKKKDVTMWSD